MSTGKLPSLVILRNSSLQDWQAGLPWFTKEVFVFRVLRKKIQRPNLISATSAGVPTKAALPPAVIPVQILGDFYIFFIENTLFDIFLNCSSGVTHSVIKIYQEQLSLRSLEVCHQWRTSRKARCRFPI